MHVERDERDQRDRKIPKRIRDFEATEDEVIAWYMRGVLERAGGNQCEAQRVLAIDRSTIRRRIEKFGLRRGGGRQRRRASSTPASSTRASSSRGSR